MLLDMSLVQRVWGGNRFSTSTGPIGEVWLVHNDSLIVRGPCVGLTLAAAVGRMGRVLLGQRLVTGSRHDFPLLIKLIDAAEWLSIQVHPDDADAVALEGPGRRGKTEAWYVLHSEPGSKVLAGIQPGVTPAQIETAVRAGDILDLMQRFNLEAGDALLLPAGAVHALGPGLFIYEIQQNSDITYRLFDWNRPAAEGRPLHIERSIRSAKPELPISPIHIDNPAPGDSEMVIRSGFFSLELCHVGEQPLELAPGGEAFHIVTVIEGEAALRGPGWNQTLKPYETAVIPAAVDRYSIEGVNRARLLLAKPA